MRSTVRRWLTTLAIWLAAGASIMWLISIVMYFQYLFGTPVDVKATRCELASHSGAACYGSWTVDGKQEYGQIAGAAHIDQKGKVFHVHAIGNSTYTAPTMGFEIALGTSVIVVVALVVRRPLKDRPGRP